jgi:hypothetical protein
MSRGLSVRLPVNFLRTAAQLGSGELLAEDDVLLEAGRAGIGDVVSDCLLLLDARHHAGGRLVDTFNHSLLQSAYSRGYAKLGASGLSYCTGEDYGD